MKLIMAMFVWSFVSNFVMGQQTNSEVIEDFVVKNIDTFLFEKNISREELIVEFENILIDNNFSSADDISDGYLIFYDYQKNPFSSNRHINQVDIKDFPNLSKFRSCNIEILSEFLDIGPVNDKYLSLDESNYIVKTLEYLDHLRASGDVQPINFNISVLKGKGKLTDFSKLFLIMVFNSYSNYDFLLMGHKSFAAAFVEKAPKALDNNSNIDGNYWIKVQSKYLKKSIPYETSVRTLDDKGNKTIISSRDYITVFLVISQNGAIQNIYSEEGTSNDQYLIARKFFKKKIANRQPAINNGKAVVCSKREKLYFYK